MLKLLLGAFGFMLIGIGVIGIILPILPGFPFLLAGAAVLGKEHRAVRPFARRMERWRKPQARQKKD
ncbi:MAG TPA: hypothetical protein VNN73_02330 [Blastocatellia bacterium]|jgi:uncharacterized membrane protein YbaN (DUF454 family)|nr:hypothetical protein [Blastocatellia bacterium]